MMAAIQSPKVRQGRDVGLEERNSSSIKQYATMRTSSVENTSSASPPSRVFEGMLKTTTETGDIGFFSIRPSRISQPICGPRKIYHPPQPLLRRAQMMEERRNISWNAHDASSERFSMYDTASQKSASQTSDLNYPQYRSYSTTYASSTLSNRRSAASLSRRIGENDYAPRPRSPFAYSSRLVKRPPRSCFPALVDGEGVDYPPRPEVDPLLYVSISCVEYSNLIRCDRTNFIVGTWWL